MILSKLEDINKIKFNNKFKVEDALHRSVVILLGHPFTYSRTLMQIGYEPFRPILVDTLFGGSRYAYPNVFKYINYIQVEDGFLGLFRGVGFRLCSELLRDFCYLNSLDICKQIDKLADGDNEIQEEKKKKNDNDDDEEKKDENDDRITSKFDKESIFKLLRKLICESVSKTVSLTITYPLHVCFIRGCSQFIGREKIYVFNPLYFSDIIKQGNFYDGFMPRLIAELVVLWLSSSLIFSLDATIEPDKFILTYLSAFINFFVTSTMYPLHLTSTVMAVNHSSNLLASKIEPPFYSWRTCYDSLEKRNQLKRGSSLIWRYVANAYKPQAYVRPYFADDD